jgi:uncharacterized protein (DUF1778 family)
MLEKSKAENRPTTQFRFSTVEHRDLVREAAELSGLSVNAWIVNVTLQAARKQLSKN